MSGYIMNRESLKRHCKAMCERFINVPTSGAYGEHSLVLELLEQTEWIPVSERLPERSVWVLAYCKTKDGYEYQAVLLLGKYNGEWTDCDDFCDDVIAWMPLPEPYKAESEVRNEINRCR